MRPLSARAEAVLTLAHPFSYLKHRLKSEGPSSRFVEQLHLLVSALGPQEVRDVDEGLRGESAEMPLSRAGAPFLEAFAAVSSVAVALLTCHGDGFLRQAALLHLMGSEDVDAVWPFLLVRLNDWVEPVRRAALSAATDALPRVSMRRLIQHFPLLEALRHFTRADHSSFLEGAMARLCQPEALAGWAEQLDAIQGPSRRAAFRVLLTGPEAVARSAVERGLKDSDPVVQRLAVEHVESLFSEEALPRVLEDMECSRTMFVRREAYALYARRVPALSEVKVREALRDPHPAIRDYAQRRLSGTVDVARLYRGAIHDIPPLPGALAGLGETGGAADVPLLEPFLTHRRVAVRRAAILAVGRLDGDGAAPLLREHFLDPAPSVCRAAAHALAQRPGRFTGDWLSQCLRRAGLAPHVLRAALPLTEILPRFDALSVLLEATEWQEGRSRERAQDALHRWLHLGFRRFVPSPPPARIHALREAVRTARHLSASLAQALDHQLRAFEP